MIAFDSACGPAIPERMKRLQEEIRKFMDDRRMKQGSFADMVGVSQATVSRWLRSDVPSTPDSDQIRSLSKVLKLDVLALLSEDGQASDSKSYVAPNSEGKYTAPPRFFSSERTMPVYAAAEGGDGFIIVSKDAIEYVERPYILESVPDAYAILVTGESMVPAFEPEDKGWVNPRLPPARNKDCVFYNIDEYNDSKATIKRLISWTDTFWLVQQYNPPKRLKLPRPQWDRCHRVVGKFNA